MGSTESKGRGEETEETKDKRIDNVKVALNGTEVASSCNYH